jgi:hypothetical protein
MRIIFKKQTFPETRDSGLRISTPKFGITNFDLVNFIPVVQTYQLCKWTTGTKVDRIELRHSELLGVKIYHSQLHVSGDRL